MFSFANLFQAALLILNAMAILSERRFLAKYGLASASLNEAPVATPLFDQTFGAGSAFGAHSNGGQGNSGSNSLLKQQVAQLLSSVRMLLRWPLVFLNAATIVFALIFG